ncbi:hypothetical protein HZB60_12315 [candidate division KSB1 bacterium]|nr:hypothetical protein [candidate division KSB1 bacterium]
MEWFEQQIRDLLCSWVNDGSLRGRSEEVIQLIDSIGPQSFVHQLVTEYMVQHDQPFSYELEWPNFRLQLSMSVWFSQDIKSYELYILPADSRMNFDAPELATNGWIRSRGENASDLAYGPTEDEQLPDNLRFVRSQSTDGVTYCFVPLLRRTENGQYEVMVSDVQKGLRKALNSIIWGNDGSSYATVLIIPFGLELLTHEMDDLIWVVWNELRSAGHRRSLDDRKSVEGMTIKLAFGNPGVVTSFLKVMLNEGEVMHNLQKGIEATDPDIVEVPLPPAITSTWKKSYLSDYEIARRNPAIWKRHQTDVPRIASDILTKIQYDKGVRGVTFREYMTREAPERIQRMLVARRVIVAYNELVKSRRKDYRTLLLELGFISRDESDEPGGAEAANHVGFKNYMSDLGLSKSVLSSPRNSYGLWPEELEWLTDYLGPLD